MVKDTPEDQAGRMLRVGDKPNVNTPELIHSGVLASCVRETVAAASQQVGMITMLATDRGEWGEVLDTVAEKTEVPERVVVADRYALLRGVSPIHPMVGIRRIGDAVRLVSKTRQIRAEGVETAFTNPYLAKPPESGRAKHLALLALPTGATFRNHIKAAVVDDTTFGFGGCNFNRRTEIESDYLLKIDDEAVADFMMNVIRGYRSERRLTMPGAYTFGIGEIILESETPGRSRIYQVVNELASDQDVVEIDLCSQIAPIGRLAGVLKQQQDKLGIDSVRVFTNSVGSNHLRGGLRVFPVDPNMRLHAKAAVVEFRDGTVVTVSSSSDFFEPAIAVGFSECALVSTDPNLAAQVRTFMDNAVEGRTIPEYRRCEDLI